jgi:hypothetical protein
LKFKRREGSRTRESAMREVWRDEGKAVVDGKVSLSMKTPPTAG